MEILNKNNWYVKENELSISLMNFHARIHVHKKDDIVVFQVMITSQNMDNLILTFSSLEEAVTFIQSVVSPCFTMEELLDKCKEIYQDKKLKVKKHKVTNSFYPKNDNLK